MLNFGACGAPLGFILLAAVVAYARALNTRLSSPSDPRWYFVPILSVACIVFVSSDLDNVLFVLTQHALVPFLLLKLCSGKLLRPERARTGLARMALEAER